MEQRRLSPLDRLLSGIDSAMKTVAAPATRVSRPNPAAEIPEHRLSERDRTHAAGLMRVNHAGEVAAQALYQGHASVARDRAVQAQMTEAAREEKDHLGWCEQRLQELGAAPSLLGPFWYAGAFAIGAASGVLGDRWSLGFIEETERQVSQHLSGHLDRLPENDARSRAIVEKMREEEEQHGANARAAGAALLPKPVRDLMRASAGLMTRTAYWI
ncbi:MAG: 2-polyprenyl-3-methyl-6-methoxy-1,4-benzoquinone monooxygenase [Gammaproteobacteria bacterium]|nr:2-polyprenyl-3-methyl-6-methoxy-1,4-benzoquinone monooxygenase [Gammaproteobacteria bacterium]